MFAEQTPNQLCYEKIFFLIAVTGLVLGLAGCEKDPKSVPVASVEITSESPTLEVGDKITLAAQVLPADADDKSVTWSSASPAIAIVDSTSGEVTAVGVGTVQITVTTTDGAKTDDIAVKVTQIDVLSKIYNTPFRTWCKSRMSVWDTDNDGELSPQEAAKVKIMYLYPEETKYTSLKGIEYFTGLTHLFCGSHQLTKLDLSKNTALTELSCAFNQLTELDVSGCTELTKISCGFNQLTELDVSGCTALTTLWCYLNQLSSLDVSNNTALTNFDCSSNQLTSIDVSNNTALTNFDCSSNQLTELDLSKSTELTYLVCDNNQLTSLDVSDNAKLTFLFCRYNNQLTSIDISANTRLFLLDCENNPALTTVYAWFDNSAVPSNFTAPVGFDYVIKP